MKGTLASGSSVKWTMLFLWLLAPLVALNAQTQHSSFADTVGLRADLRRIEMKLGPANGRDQLQAIEVSYFSFADAACTIVDKKRQYSGILIVHSCVAADVKAIFEGLRRDTFPIAKVIPVNCYGLNADTTGWDDAASMRDNNTSAFNYRSKSAIPDPSKHALGIAVDINPVFNPCIRRDGGKLVVEPLNGRYDVKRPGTLSRDNILKHLEPRGWSWGGRWPKPKDYQHIEKSHGRCVHFSYGRFRGSN